MKSHQSTLPCRNDDNAMKELLHACRPATFGLKGKDVYDESYRKAPKLDESQFSTNFSPDLHGIIRVVEQMLLPSATW